MMPDAVTQTGVFQFEDQADVHIAVTLEQHLRYLSTLLSNMSGGFLGRTAVEFQSCPLCWRALLPDENTKAITPDAIYLARLFQGELRLVIEHDHSIPGRHNLLGVHHDCYNFLQSIVAKDSFSKCSRDLFTSLAPDFHLTNRAKERRGKAAFQISFSALGHVANDADYGIVDPSHPRLFRLLSRLPPELLLEISEHVWPDRISSPVTVLVECSRLLNHLYTSNSEIQSRPHIFSWGNTIETTELNVQGVTYISGLHVCSRQNGQAGQPGKLVVCYGELGVIKIQFVEKSQQAKRHKDALWYQVYERTTASFQIHYKPLLVGSITALPPTQPTALSTAQSNIFWDTPNPPKINPRYAFHPRPASPNRVTLRHVDLTNAPTGLAIIYDHGSIIGLEALHSPTQPHVLAHLDASPAHVHAILPIQNNERISRIWARARGSRTRAALVVQMSSGDYHTLGPAVPQRFRETHTFHALQGEDDGDVAGLCYSVLGGWAGWNVYFAAVCAERTGRRGGRAPLVPPWPQAGLPFSELGVDWFFSKASLGGVAGIRLCVDGRGRDRCILGMLVTYHDGVVKALGQWRGVDVEVEELVVLREHRFIHWQGGVLAKVRQVVLMEGETRSSEEWTSAPLDGSLVWWFSWSEANLEHQL